MHLETERETVLYSKHLTLFHRGTHSANSQPFAVWDAEENRKGQRGGEVRERLSLVRIQPFAWEESIFVKSYKCPYHVKLDLDLDLEHNLDAGPSGENRVQVWSRSSHLPARRSDFRARTKVPVSRDL